MVRFLLVFALILFLLWWLKRLLWRMGRKARSARHHDAIDASYEVLDDEKDKMP